tara:strand:+ start:1086 stop:1457 length:372 start_codon:yes stop_codon:yes gene_type:complete
MSRGVNKVILVGNVGQDPESKHLDSGAVLVEFSVATSRAWTTKAGEKEESTEWHRVKAWNKTAEFIERSVRKGSQVYIEGRLETRSWEGDDGKKVYRTEVNAFQVELLGRRDDPEYGDDDLPF